jgi:amidase
MRDIPIDDPLGAFIRHDAVRRNGAPGGPLAGLTFAAKDIFDVEGHVTGGGNPDWLRTHGRADGTAPAILTLLNAGATLIGKTQTDEMAFSMNGENHHYGAPVNPFDPGRITGGSSCGSASAVAGGLVDFALGSDTGGSIRIPGSFCGLFGLRPTHGRIPATHMNLLAPSYDTVGWFADSAALFARVGRVLLPEDAPQPAPTRLLLAEDAFAASDDNVRRALQPAVERLAAAVAAPEAVTIAPEGLAAWAETFRVVQLAEAWETLGAWIRSVQPTFGPGVRDRFAAAEALDPLDVAKARGKREAVAAHVLATLGDDTVLCLPSTPCIALRRGAALDVQNSFRGRTLALTCISPHARTPALTLPLAKADGMPIGLSVMGPPGSDGMLLDLAERVGAAAPAAGTT